MKIIGLEVSIEETTTGVNTTFHVVAAYSVMLLNGTSSVTFGSYVSEAAWRAGKRPIGMVAAQLKEVPTGDLEAAPTWFCEAVLRADANHFSGAKPVLED